MAQLLKHKRNESGLPLGEIARITRIKESYLRAIEDEDFPKLPIEVYTRGYIREYANFLGVPLAEAIAPYERYLGLQKAPAGSTPQGKSPISGAKPGGLPSGRDTGNSAAARTSPGTPPAKGPVLRALTHRRLAWVLPVLLAVLIIYSGLPGRKDDTRPQPKLEEPAPTGQTPPPALLQTETPPAVGLQPPPEQAPPEVSPVSDRGAPHRLDILATDRVWLQITIDGSEKRDMLLKQGDRVSYSASESFSLKIGNAGGLRLVYNQKELDNLGPKGQVIRLNFPDQDPSAAPGRTRSLREQFIPSSEASHQ